MSTQALQAAPSGWQAWWLAARPKTLPLAVAPVLVGSAVAHAGGGFRLGPALAALAGAAWIQIGTNFANDVFDAEQGADREDRLGPPRAVSSGWLSPVAVRAGMAFAFGLATLAGLYLVWAAGWPVVAIGVVSILAGIAYTGGPYPLGYHGLGDVAVFFVFGFVAVCGTFWVQTLTLTSAAWVAAIPVGALATAVLVVNNLRDVDSDRRAGKHTLAVRLGARAVRVEYAALVALAFATPLAWSLARGAAWPLLPLAALPLAPPLLRSLWRDDGARLNETLADTARLALVFSLLWAAGLALSA